MNKTMKINHEILGESQKFFSKRGFDYIDAPWTVTRQISDIIKPAGAGDFSNNRKK